MEKLIREIISTKIFKLTNEDRAEIEKIEEEYKGEIEEIRKRLEKAVDSVKDKNVAAMKRIDELLKSVNYTRIKDYYHTKSLEDIYAIADDDYEKYLEDIANKHFSKEVQEEIDFLVHLMNSQYQLIKNIFYDFHDSSNSKSLVSIFNRRKNKIIEMIKKIFKVEKVEVEMFKNQNPAKSHLENSFYFYRLKFSPDKKRTYEINLKSPKIVFDKPEIHVDDFVFDQIRNVLRKTRQ